MIKRRWDNVAAARRRVWYMVKMKEETIKDIIEESYSGYNGKFWNRHIKDYQTWKENKKWEEKFYSFCGRMWLDNEDENLTLPAADNRLSKQAYINKYEYSLLKKFLEEENNA